MNAVKETDKKYRFVDLTGAVDFVDRRWVWEFFSNNGANTALVRRFQRMKPGDKLELNFGTLERLK